MGSLSPIHWLLVIGIAVLLFGGRGKISDLMGDVAGGIKAFKKGLAEDDDKPKETAKSEPVKTIDHQATGAGASQAQTEQRAEGVRS